MFKKKILMKYLSNFVLQSFMVLNVSKTVWIHKSFKTIWYKADSIDDLINLYCNFCVVPMLGIVFMSFS